MNKVLWVALGVLLGIGVGTTTSRHLARQHERTTAVMVLLSLHQSRWESAFAARDACVSAEQERKKLYYLADEIPVVLPRADQEDPEFHAGVIRLRDALAIPCIQDNGNVEAIRAVREACQACHQQYR